ncbi:MAG: hypothetical protein KGZ96_00550 [Clostridia bacterium]|jgi:septal ring factor EnvC (AmiA/AmiB activator)|nr:hypothetical protein [Clostridia bacterium]
MSKIFQLADRLKELKDRKKDLDGEVKVNNSELEKVSEDLSQAMLEEEMANFVRSGQMFYLTTKIFASADKTRKQELFSWLKANDFGDMVQETVNANTLAAFVREILDEQDKLPEKLEQLVNVHEKTLVGMRKAK